MQNHFKLPIILLACFLISSCAALRVPNLNNIAIGMSKSAVIANLRKQPDEVIGAKKYPAGIVEVIQYTTSITANGHAENTWLCFFNDKLVQFGKPTTNWLIEADNVVADNTTL